MISLAASLLLRKLFLLYEFRYFLQFFKCFRENSIVENTVHINYLQDELSRFSLGFRFTRRITLTVNIFLKVRTPEYLYKKSVILGRVYRKKYSIFYIPDSFEN